ncbi:hypothetical protein ACFFWC_30870 [Plantactinospora siamensis]|uniref:Uncharacterized protein n=1 Tax=Plantactinospora siamensis TaxID=555372 RepID=A0ABV6NSA6_9ACTN
MFRPTWRQIVVHAVATGLVALVGLLLAAALFGALRPRVGAGAGFRITPAVAAGLAGAAAPLVAVGSGLARWRAAACVNSAGLSANGVRRSGPVPWERVTDIRAERRRRRTVVVVYAGDEAIRRLPAPYDGDLLAGDPRFERKLFLIQHLWETHRSWSPLG